MRLTAFGSRTLEKAEKGKQDLPESSTTSQRSAIRKDHSNRLIWVKGGILLALAVAVVLLRLQRLSELPPGLDAGEGANGLDALRVLQGEHAVFFSEKFGGREGMVMYAIALAISLFGRTEFALRLPTALASAGTVFVVFWLGQLFFGHDEKSGRPTPWRGVVIGGVGAGLMAVSIGQTIMGRTAFRTSLLPFFLCLCFALLWRGWRQPDRGRSLWWIVLAGVCSGLLPYTYIPARLVPVLLFFFGMSFLLPLRTSAGETDGSALPLSGVAAAFERARTEMPKILVFVGVAGLLAAPILFHFALHPEQILSRSAQVSLFDPYRSEGDPLGTLLRNVRDHLLAFGFRGDPIWRNNFAGRPMLNPVEALFFWLGVGMAIWRWQWRPSYRLLLLWLCVLMLPAMLARDAAPSTLRMIGVSPAVFLLIGVGMWESFRFLKEFLYSQSWRASQFIEEYETNAALAMGLVVGALILAQGANTYRDYFQKWAAAPETFRDYDAGWTELAQFLAAQPSPQDSVYLIPGYTWYSLYSWQYSLGYLYQDIRHTQMISVGAFNLAPAVESTLAATEDISTVKFVDWDNDIVGGDTRADEQIAFLLGKYGRYQGAEEGSSFQILDYTDISLDIPWTTYERLEPIEIQYDGGISLYGFALGQGTQQLSSQEPFILGEREQANWVAIQWESAPGLEIEYSISLRLHNAEGEVVHQRDAVLRDPNSTSTKNWSAGVRVDTLHYLELPADLAPGEYEMRLVVYDFATLKPTVEIGVWEPETVLARLRFDGVQ